MEPASPTAFDALLISDNDKGSLNSELFARYLLNDKWGIRGGTQFLFTEFTTDSEVQQSPESNDNEYENNTGNTPVVDPFDPMQKELTLLRQVTLTDVGHTASRTEAALEQKHMDENLVIR